MPATEIAIFEPIEHGLARRVKQQLANARGQVVLLLHSPGGSVWETVALHSLLASHPGGVEIRIVGVAASSATVLAMSARPGGLKLAAEGWMLLHQPHLPVDGPAEYHQWAADLLRRVSDEIATIYARRSGLSLERVNQLMRDETWIDAAEAKELNLVDSILPASRVAASASWNPETFFAHFPRNERKTIVSAPTIAELKAACPGATADFILAQAEAGADVAAAKAAFLDVREKAIAEREAKAAARPGVQPLVASAVGQPVTEGADEFGELLAEEITKGTDRLQAVKMLGRRHPQAHRAYVESHNSDSPRVRSLIAERFAL